MKKGFGGAPFIALITACLGWQSASAATFTVVNLDDSGAGSLRQAITDANANGIEDTIDFDASLNGIIVLASSLPNIAEAAGLTIDGGNRITVSGNNAVRPIIVDSVASLSLDNLAIINGTDQVGGGIFIFSQGTLILNNSTLSGNSASSGGGGIYNLGGIIILSNSTLSDNSAGFGGGIYNNIGTVTLSNSTVSGNGASNSGGGIYNYGFTVSLTNSTLSSNRASGGGGGIRNSGGTVDLSNSTLSGNIGVGIYNDGILTLSNNLIANSPGGDCFNNHILTDNGHNLVEDGSCDFVDGVNNNVVADPLLGPLANNGGPTQTFALQAGSPAIDAGDNNGNTGLDFDQRGSGFARISNGTVDIGAFEVQVPVPAFSKSFMPDTVPTGGASTLTFTIDNTASDSILGALDFTDTLPAGLSVADPANGATTCSGGVLTAIAGSGSVSYTGGTVSAAASCTVSAEVTSTTPGMYVNTSGDLTSSAGSSGTAAANLTVTNTNPVLVINAGLTLLQGETVTIGSAQLVTTDAEQAPAELTYTIGSAPANGTLANNGVSIGSGDTFTQAEIDANLIAYSHDGSATSTDGFTFTVSDGVGGSIGETSFPINLTAPALTEASVPAATGTGQITLGIDGGGPACTIVELVATMPEAVVGGGPPDIAFPHGLVGVRLEGCTPGSTVMLTIAFPAALPAGTQYFKYGPTPEYPSPDWYVLPAAITGNVVSYGITDGGLGDDDLAANGVIADPGGPGSVAVGGAEALPVPVAPPWLLAGLALLVLATAWRYGGERGLRRPNRARK